MTDTKIISIETLRKLLIYDPEAGTLTWRERGAEWFKDGKRGAENSARTWNTKNAGKTAFTFTDNRGCKQGAVFKVNYKAHRVVWAMHYGAWPVDQIDHINGNPSDNRIANLRDVSHKENMRNRKLPSTNTSGHVGVCWHRKARKWHAQIQVGGVNKHLGEFDEKADAIATRAAAEIKYGFHENHGRSA